MSAPARVGHYYGETVADDEDADTLWVWRGNRWSRTTDPQGGIGVDPPARRLPPDGE